MEIKRYLSRRGYRRLDYGTTTTGQRKKIQIIRMRGPHRDWRIRTSPKLRWMIRSPLKLVTKVKSIYMNFMLKLAGNVGGSLNTDNKFGVKKTLKARQGSSKGYSGDAFEARLIFEISKTLVASHELYSI
ncbi:uncharacterized protein LOC127126829 [Lathyrus oleraceus]|uniref:Uncharacterized protein n=1 Tax=Pisum sativum TaxID=3888 RepID=A0A9D4XVE2_PEA|nr:uncharacterized protein LOC127126829 [Pisum sativum]KAI5428141.1 hypothetical protein KIW84_033229 [Pisum sativum]